MIARHDRRILESLCDSGRDHSCPLEWGFRLANDATLPWGSSRSSGPVFQSALVSRISGSLIVLKLSPGAVN